MKKILLLFTILLFSVVSTQYSYSQNKEKTRKQHTVSGTVYDDFGDEMPGVSVFVKNSPGLGTSTDSKGKFTIKVNANSVLVIQFVGMQPHEVFVNKDIKDLKITLKEDSKQIEEVVVTGYSSQKKVSVVGAISSLDIDQIKTPATSLTNMIGGRLAGVITMQTSGEPGKNLSNFWIRGISTFGADASALVLIDGIEGNLNDIDPDDVESFSILKDASATAVYGVRGANGVVIVTTKKGEKGKLEITGRATFKLSQIKRLPEYLGAYDYALLANEAKAMSGEHDLYTPLQLEIIKNGLDRDLYPDVNWTDEIMKKVSTQQNYYVSAKGGGEIATYFVALGYQTESAAYNQEDNLFKEPLSYNKLTYRTNVTMNLTNSTKMDFRLDGALSNHTQPGGVGTGALWKEVRQINPLMLPVKYSDGTFPVFGVTGLTSPFVNLNHRGYSSSDNNNTSLSINLNQSFSGALKGLTLDLLTLIQTSARFSERRSISPNLYYAVGRTPQGTLIKNLFSPERQMSYSNSNSTDRRYRLEARANWTRSFGKHSPSALLMYSMEDYKSSSWSDGLGIAAIPARRQDIAGRLSYGYNNCYFVDANFGYTGSAQFEKGKRFGFFPSLAIGWVPTAYEWVENKMPWLSFLKLRASVGQVGSDRITNTRFPYLTLISINQPTFWGHRGRGIQEQVKGADNLIWEVATKYNAGVDLKLFGSKLSMTVDVFRDERDNIFQPRVTLPDYIGMITRPYSNVGRMHSYGSDGNISYTHEINKDMYFTVRANYTFSQNIVDYFEENKLPYDYLSAVGKPHGIVRGYISEGLFKSREDIETSPSQSTFGVVRPGDIKYRDVNGDGRITSDDKVPLSYGNQVPRFAGGIGGDFTWKDLTVSFLVRGSAGVEYYRSGFGGNEAGWVPFYNGERGNVIKLANNPKNRWTPSWYSGNKETERDDVEFPRLSYGGNGNNSQISTFWKRDGSFIRFQELGFKYRLKNKSWLKKAGLTSLDLEFVMNNLFTIDGVKFFDPEQASANGAAYPLPTTYTLQAYFRF